MDDRKKSFQVKLDLLILECNMACKNINAALQLSSSLVTHLLKETDHVQFSKNWPDVMAGIDAFTHPVTELNRSLDKQLRILCSVERLLPVEPQMPSRSVNVSASSKNASVPESSSFANIQLHIAEHPCANGIINTRSSSNRQSACQGDTMSVPMPFVQQPTCSGSNMSMPLPVVQESVHPTRSTSMFPVIKQPVINVGSVLKMIYLHGDTPESFWLRFASDDKINKAKKAMMDKIVTLTVKALDTCPSVGDYVCTLLNKSPLVRGEVRTVKNCAGEGVKFVLLDVDSGNTVIVDSRNIWKQEPDLAAVPAQAVHCRLKGKLGNVPPRAFVDMCTDRHLHVKFCSLLKGSYPYYAVELVSCDPTTGDKINVNKWVARFFSPRSFTPSSAMTPHNIDVNAQIDVDTPNENDKSFVVTHLSAAGLLENGSICHETEKNSTTISSVKNESSAVSVSSVQVSASTNANTVQQDMYNLTSDQISSVDATIEANSVPEHAALFGEIVHCVSPSEFFLHVGRNIIKARQLSEKLLLHYSFSSNIQKNKKDAMRKVGIYCACLFGGVYYRAKIIDWMQEDQENICVHFMDYGHTGCVHFTSIQSLHHEFAELPGLANRCHLSNVLPADSHGKVGDDWSSDAIKYFNELLQREVQYAVYVADNRINDPPGSLAVILVDESGGESKIINDSLLANGYAVSITEFTSENTYEGENGFVILAPTSPDSSGDLECFDPMMEDHNSNLNTYDHDVEDARFVVSGWKSTDEEQVCPLFRRLGYCRRPPGTCMKRHITLDPNGVVTDKEMIYYKAFAELTLPKSENFRILLTAADSLSVLYFVLVKEVTGSCEDAEEEDEETLISLTTYMNEVNSVHKMKRLLVPLALSQVVIAKHLDCLWYRATVVGWVGNRDGLEQVLVQFVDSGETVPVLENDLRNIEPKYLHLPFQAVEFSLANLKLDSLNEMEIGLYLEKLQGMIGMEFSATVVSWTPTLELVLNSDDGELVRLLEEQVLNSTTSSLSTEYQDM